MRDTKGYRSLSLYSIFPRNFSAKGDFSGIIPELDRIKAMGFDAIWLLPIHPIGQLNRKGEMGSPYSIRDYFAINPDYGTAEDFTELIRQAHNRDLKVIVDVVFHHTSWDSVLMDEHRQWFYHKPDGSIGNKVGDWSDIADLDFNYPELWDHLIGALRKLADYGVDGFRCDVAPLIPIEFWLKARAKLEEEGFRLIWLSESIEPDFIRYLRRMGHTAHSDGEMYAAFDILYDYDLYPELKDYFQGKQSMKEFLKGYTRQEWILPDFYVKLRFLENHDQIRARDLIRENYRLKNATAFMMFLKGAWLFYNGQETGTAHKPDLFDPDPIEWEFNEDMIRLQTKLNALKKEDFFWRGYFSAEPFGENIAHISYEASEGTYHGWFNIGPQEEELPLELAGAAEFLYIEEQIKPHKNFRLPLIYFSKNLEDLEK